MSEDSLESALKFLATSEQEFANAVGLKAVVDDLQKIAYSQAFLDTEGRGNNAEREAMAKTTEGYRAAVARTQDAYTHEALMRAKRLRAEATIEVWRTQEASRRRGNV